MKKAFIKKEISLLVIFAMMFSLLSGLSINASAAQTKKSTVSGIIYYYTVSNKAATITSAEYKSGSSKTLTLPSKLGGYAVKTIASNATQFVSRETVVIPDSVETLEDCSIGNTKTKNVKLGKNLKTIKGDPFSRCNHLSSISVNSNNKYFMVSKSVLYNKSKTVLYKYPAAKIPASYTVLSSVKTISNRAFADSSKLKNITLGKSVKTIKADAFFASSALTKFAVNKNNKNFLVKDGVLYNKKKTVIVFYPCAKSGSSYTVVSGVTKVSSRAFADALKLTEVKLPSSVTEIASKAFSNAGKLKTLSLPSKLKTIGNNAFESTALTQVTAPKTLETMGSGAYEFCSKLKSVDLSKSKLTKINSRTFSDCEKITEIKFPKTLTAISTAFGNTAITKLDLPAGVTSVSNNAFSGCKKLSSIIVRGAETDISKCVPKEQYIAYADENDSNGYIAYKYNFTITAPKGSKAERFALENSIEFFELA
jgi:hypothetical protein